MQEVLDYVLTVLTEKESLNVYFHIDLAYLCYNSFVTSFLYKDNINKQQYIWPFLLKNFE